MPLSVVSTLALLLGVDVKRSKHEQDKFLLDERAAREEVEARLNVLEGDRWYESMRET